MIVTTTNKKDINLPSSIFLWQQVGTMSNAEYISQNYAKANGK
jgi:hypothetical protein